MTAFATSRASLSSRRLDLSYTNISDVTLHHLASFTNLKSLGLCIYPTDMPDGSNVCVSPMKG